jgi:hypothetical protein
MSAIAPHRSRRITGIEDGDDVLEAVESLEEPTTAEIADYVGIDHVAALHTAGMLGSKSKGFIEHVKARPANPRWRLPVDDSIVI